MKRKAWIAFAVVAAAIVGWLLGRQLDPNLIACLSVGQGDCAVLASDGVTVLIDVGPRSGKYDAGDKLVIPALRRLGIRTVDLILLSHPDMDHVGGLVAIHRTYPNAKIAISAEFRSWPSMLERLQDSGLDPSQIQWLPTNCQLSLGEMKLRIWCPSMNGHENDNDGSMFVHVTDGQATADFSGDAPSEVERVALTHGDWSAQVLKAGHHGSKTATCQEWIAAVKPKVAILSLGRNNRYGHPHRDVVDRLQSAGVEVWRTDRQGDAVFDVTPQGFVLRR